MRPKNLYLAMLEYGANSADKDMPVDAKKLVEHLEEMGFDLSETYKRGQLDRYMRDIYGFEKTHILFGIIEERSGSIYRYTAEFSNIHVTSESYQNYIEFVELKEARDDAKNAKQLALIAILIAIAGTVITTVISLVQMSAEVTIDSAQVQKLEAELNQSTNLQEQTLTELKRLTDSTKEAQAE